MMAEILLWIGKEDYKIIMATTKIVKVTILLRRDTLENWVANNPILQSGEMSYVTDVGKCKVGDGQTHWIDLPYFILETDLNDNARIVIKDKDVWPDYDRVISTKGVIYVYADSSQENIAPKIKIGDGLAYICDLPFTVDTVNQRITDHINNGSMHITDAQRAFWNDKVTAYIHPNDLSHLILDDGTLSL